MQNRTKNCRKCGNKIPCKARIAGLIRNLSNRRFCLVCSPFGLRNTNATDPGHVRISASRRKPYAQWTDTQRMAHRNQMREAGRARKLLCIEWAGGKCIKCGYDSCAGALDFHHRIPSEKLFELTARNMGHVSLERLKAEVEKCDLLCANCHREQHIINHSSGVV